MEIEFITIQPTMFHEMVVWLGILHSKNKQRDQYQNNVITIDTKGILFHSNARIDILFFFYLFQMSFL